MTTPMDTHRSAEKWTPTLDTFGARLAAIRQRLNWNVKEAAIACGLPPENWRRWEQEDIEPRRLITIAMAIATRTGCDLDWLVYGPGQATAGANKPTGWYVDELFAPSETSVPEGRVIHRDGRRNAQTRRSGSRGRRVRIATGTPPARASVN